MMNQIYCKGNTKEFIIKTLHKNPKDRALLLKLEAVMTALIYDKE